MRWSYRAFTVKGISIELHLTFILLFMLLMFGGLQGILIFTLLFSIVLAHELMHSLTAQFYGIKVPRIILTPLGGLASIELPEDPVMEFTVSIVGPLFNFMLAIVGILLVMSIDQSYGFLQIIGDLKSGDFNLETAVGLMRLFVTMNLVLGGFNILPAFPMDGGRVLRGVLGMWMDYLTATRLANTVAQVMFLAFIAYGIFAPNIWLIIIGVFLSYAGGSEYRYMSLKRLVGDSRLIDLADPSLYYVNSSLTWGEFLSTVYRRGQNLYLMVDSAGMMRGVLDLTTVRNVEPDKPVGQTPGAEYVVLEGSLRVADTLKILLSQRLVLVVASGKLAGTITADNLSDSLSYFNLFKRLN